MYFAKYIPLNGVFVANVARNWNRSERKPALLHHIIIRMVYAVNVAMSVLMIRKILFMKSILTGHVLMSMSTRIM